MYEDGNIVSEGAPLVPNQGPSVDALHQQTEQQQQRQPKSTQNSSDVFAKPNNIPISRVAQVILLRSMSALLRLARCGREAAATLREPLRFVIRYASTHSLRPRSGRCGREAAAMPRDPANARRSAPGQVIRARRKPRENRAIARWAGPAADLKSRPKPARRRPSALLFFSPSASFKL